MTPWELAKAKLGLKGEKGMAKCPAHPDAHASLAYRRNGDDINLTCFASCSWKDVRDALGLGPKTSGATNPVSSPRAYVGPVLEATHRYTDLDGRVVAEKRKLRYPDGTKQTPWSSPDDTGTMRPGLNGVGGLANLNLYNVVAASHAVRDLGQTLLVPEGEGCVDRLTELGLAAVTLPEGASGARSAYEALWRWDVFPHGSNIVLLPDADVAGEKHALRLADVLADRFTVSILRFPELSNKQDVADWIKAKRALHWTDGELADELHYRAVHAMPHIPSADVPGHGLIGSDADAEAYTERAAILADANGWPLADCERIARAQVSARVARERASLTPAQRLALETTDPELRAIYSQLASYSA